ncbi:crocetin glucosyltransferase, chloroplastic-like [Asparagus officinalis]|nr:crocetin glucosyltransferase, chloroplastic-like [Asparagus officinalis]
MIVAWCSQVGVLTHPSVGCFVTHCGWNSTLESLLYGVPAVGMPQKYDQTTNAMLIERVWGTGVRVDVNDDGVVGGEEVRRCLDVVMGEGERGMTIRRNVEVWREKVAEAVGDGGSSDRNLRALVNEIGNVEGWKEKVAVAVGGGGSSDRNLRALVNGIATS